MLAAILRPLVRLLVTVLSSGLYALGQGIAFLLRPPLRLIAICLTRNTLPSALLGCAFSTCVYVGFLYVWRALPRDHPSTIKRRMLSAGAACCVSWIPLAISLTAPAREQGLITPVWPESLSPALGLSAATTPKLALSILATLGHTSVLFALPLTYKLLRDGESIWNSLTWWLTKIRFNIRRRDMWRAIDALMSPLADRHLWMWRNMVAAPVTEEFVFRACMAPLLLRAGCSQAVTIAVTPLFFGSAHLHHVGELVKYQRLPFQTALTQVAAQFVYTTVFGWYATWLFLRSGSLWCPVASHVLCNWLGLPDFLAMARRFGDTLVIVGTILSILVFIGLMLPNNEPPYPGTSMDSGYTGLR